MIVIRLLCQPECHKKIKIKIYSSRTTTDAGTEIFRSTPVHMTSQF